MEINISKANIKSRLREMGVTPGMQLEVHSSLSSFGAVDGGAQTLITALMETVTAVGAIVMPSFLLSKTLPLTDEDKKLGLTLKIKILPEDENRTGMGIVSDTFRQMNGIVTGHGTFRVSAWGKDAEKHVEEGFGRIIANDGYALLMGVDIYRLSSMHYVENALPEQIRDKFKPPEEARKLYPESEWLIESWSPPEKPWYKIQDKAYKMGFIKDFHIGSCKCMFFKVNDVIEIYRDALLSDPFGLYGLRQE